MLILAYHRVNPEVRDGLSVSPSTLRQHMVGLLERGLRNVVLEELIDSGEAFPHDGFAVTFDDGYQDNYSHAAPVLKETGVRATVYLVRSMIDSDRPFPWLHPKGTDGFDADDLHMTTDQLLDAMASGTFVYGSHTLTHPRLSQLDRETALREISESKAGLEEVLQTPIRTFCYPSGDFNDETLDLVEQSGYEAAVVTPNRHIPVTRLTLHRVGIYSNITPALFALKTSKTFEKTQATPGFWKVRHGLRRLRATARTGG